MIIGITGGTGFIGRSLVARHIALGDTVRVLTRGFADVVFPNSLQVFRGDLTSADADLEGFTDRLDVLYHCAAELRDAPRMQAVNVEGTARLVRASAGRIGRWVQLSSVGAYGPVRTGVVIEASAEQPIGPYEVTKTLADGLVREAAGQGSFDVVVLRPSNVYGEGMPNQSVFQLFSMIERGLFFFIGPKGASANYIHVQDVVAALIQCATHADAVGKVFNVSNWDTMESLVEGAAKALGRPTPKLRIPLFPARLLAATLGRLPMVPLTVTRVDALSGRTRYSTDRIEHELGWEAKVSVRDGMAALARSWKAR